MNALECLGVACARSCIRTCHIGGDAHVLLDAKQRAINKKVEKGAPIGRVFFCSVVGRSANSRGRNASRDGRESSSMAEHEQTFGAPGVAGAAVLSLTVGAASSCDPARLVMPWSLLYTDHRRDGRSPRPLGRLGVVGGGRIGAGRMTGLTGPSVQIAARWLIDAAVKDRKNSCAIHATLHSACHCILEMKSITPLATDADRDGPPRTVDTASRRRRIGIRRCEARQTRCAWTVAALADLSKGHSDAGTQKANDVRED